VKFRSRFFGNAAIYLGANVFNAGIPFLLLPVLTRVLTPADYGIIAMFAVALSVLGAFSGLSVHGAVGVRYFQLEKKELAEYVGTCVGILVVSTTAVFMIVAVFSSWLTAVSGIPKDWLLTATVLSGFQFLGNILLSLWLSAGQAMKYGAFQISQSLFNAISSLILIIMVGLAWRGRVLGQTMAIGIFGFIALWQLSRNRLIKRPITWRTQSLDALKFGIPLIPHVIGGLIIATAGQFLVTNMFGISETGIYVVGAQIGSAMGLISDAFAKSYGPWMYERLRDDSVAGRHFIVGVTYYVFFVFIIFSAAASIGIFIIFPYIVGDNFVDAKYLTTFFIFGNGFVGMYYAVAGFFFYSSKTKFISIVTISSGIISILAMWSLGQWLGLKGVALGYLSSQVIMFLLAWIMSSLVYPMPWFQIRYALAAVSSASSKFRSI
jgi:O-antigen/teichoic acid export membrane protein